MRGSRVALGVLCASLAALAIATSAHAANPAVIYVHGLSEDACGGQNLKAVLDAIRERLPQTGLPRPPGTACGGDKAGGNPLRFHYVADRTEGGDQDVADGGSSQSGVGANASALQRYIATLAAKGQRKVMLVGFSMGGLVIRRYLAEFGDQADARVAAVAFIESAHAGSFLATAAQGIASDEAIRACEGQVFASPSGPLNAALCLATLALAREKFNIKTPDAIALRDLSPRSEAIRADAIAPIPKRPRYLNAPGDLVLRVPGGKVGEWVFGEPYDDVEIGDGVLPKGNSDPTQTPALGGALFKPAGTSARQQLLSEICTVARQEKDKMMDALISSGGRLAKDPRAKLALYIGRQLLRAAEAFGHGIDCARASTVAHWNINGHAAQVKPGRIKNLPDIVTDFLVDACKTEQLGDCGNVPQPPQTPEPTKPVANGSCGTVYASVGGHQLSSRVTAEGFANESGPTCEEAREVIRKHLLGDTTEFQHAPYAGTSIERVGAWRCEAPNMQPVVCRIPGVPGHITAE